MQIMTYGSLSSIDSATFTGSYQAIGVPFVNRTSIVKMVNNSNVLVTVSIDGTKDHDILPANSYFVYDVTANHALEYTYIPTGTQFYVKGLAGVGLVYLVFLLIPKLGVLPT